MMRLQSVVIAADDDDDNNKKKKNDTRNNSSINTRNNNKVHMEALQLWTGRRAIPFIERVFVSLLRALKQEDVDKDEEEEEDDDDDEKKKSDSSSSSWSVLDMIPDAAVVKGSMTLSIPVDDDDNE